MSAYTEPPIATSTATATRATVEPALRRGAGAGCGGATTVGGDRAVRGHGPETGEARWVPVSLTVVLLGGQLRIAVPGDGQRRPEPGDRSWA